MKTIKSFFKIIFILCGIILVTGGLILGLYLHGDINLDSSNDEVNEIVTSGKEVLDKSQTVLDSAKDKVSSLASSLDGSLDKFRNSVGLEESDGDIDVYFAPCEKLNPFGIDDRLLGFLKSASESINCAFFELQLMEAADVLIEKHREGVKVGIVSDSNYEDREAVQKCIKAGIPVVFDERSALMHNKFAVVDGKSVWTGSTNVTENGMYKNNNNALLIKSEKLAENYINEFKEMFDKKKFGSRSPKNTTHKELNIGSIPIECYFAPEDGVKKEIIAEIRDAEKTVDFMAFSFTSDDIAKALVDRMKKGVKVRGLFEKRQASSEYSVDDFLKEKGASIFMDTNKNNMHNKVIIIDMETVITGSYNFSKSAEKKNDENVIILHSSDIAKKYTKEFNSLVPANANLVAN